MRTTKGLVTGITCIICTPCSTVFVTKTPKTGPTISEDLGKTSGVGLLRVGKQETDSVASLDILDECVTCNKHFGRMVVAIWAFWRTANHTFCGSWDLLPSRYGISTL